MTLVDAHLHLWRLGSGDYSWNIPALGPAHADFTAEDADGALRRADVSAAVLVQAADTVGDTRRLLDVAARHSWAVGVVGWVPLHDARRAASMLDGEYGQDLVGVRQLVHDDPRDDFLATSEVRRTVELIGRAGLPLDVPDAWPRLWPALTALVDSAPDQVFVLDHLGKPGPRSADDTTWERDWRRDLGDLSRRSNVVAKASGLARTSTGTAGRARSSVPSVEQLVETSLMTFGAERVMLGSDWPLSLADASYSATVASLTRGLTSLSDSEREAVRGGVAARVYGLDLSRSTAATSPRPH